MLFPWLYLLSGLESVRGPEVEGKADVTFRVDRSIAKCDQRQDSTPLQSPRRVPHPGNMVFGKEGLSGRLGGQATELFALLLVLEISGHLRVVTFLQQFIIEV